MAILNKPKKDKKQAEPEQKADSGEIRKPLSEKGSRGSSVLLIKQPWITEKAGDLSALRKYVFIVDKRANKSETKKLIESIYGVKVTEVNIINKKGKAKRLGRSLGKTSAFKKAIVTLKEGQKIDIMPT